jgi:starch-binding outer membrane protein, SusD/RagB family
MRNTIIRLSLIICSLLPFSCKNVELNPVPKTEVDADKLIFTDKKAFKDVLDKLYKSFSLTENLQPNGQSDLRPHLDEGFGSFIRAYWTQQVLPTDEAIVSWVDPGLDHFQKHSWNADNVFSKALFYRLEFCETYAGKMIRNSSSGRLDTLGFAGEDKQDILIYNAEARFLRAFAYWVAFDLYRNVPLSFIYKESYPKQISTKAMFEFIEKELIEVQSTLLDANVAEYGRVNKACAQTLLAKLYLNAEVYIGEPKYNLAQIELNKVLISGYSLTAKYPHLFYADNHKEGNTEIIFPLLLDGITTQTWGATTFLVCSNLGDATMEDNKSKAGDPINNELLNTFGTSGAWYGNRPNAPLVNRFRNTLTSDTTWDPRGIFWTEGRESISITEIKNFRADDGLVCYKWRNVNQDLSIGSHSRFSDIDFPMFRLADVYLMYAECFLRGGGGDAPTALNFINQLRTRAWGDDRGNISLSDLTLDFILDERQREMYWEGTRRTDLIRFGKFTSGIWE